MTNDQPTGRDLLADLSAVLNCHCQENGSNTPDFILAEYLIDCLRAFDRATNARSAGSWLPSPIEVRDV